MGEAFCALFDYVFSVPASLSPEAMALKGAVYADLRIRVQEVR
jgi:hypothetical protein